MPFSVVVVLWLPTSRVTEVELLDSVKVVSVALAVPMEEIEAVVLPYVLTAEVLTVLVVS